MTSQDKNKFICEKLGICWHEAIDEGEGSICCSCGDSGNDRDCFEVHCKKLNPSFESEAGRVQLLKLIQDKTVFWKSRHLNIALYMLNDTGKFRDAVYRWLGGEG